MNDSFFGYLHRLELMAFFSGYPLIYILVFFIAGHKPSGSKLKAKTISLLPYAYALVGTLYFGWQLKKMYPDYSIENISQVLQPAYLIAWGLLAMLFWIPVMARKPMLSLLHSFVFFYFVVRDIFIQLGARAIDENIVRNDMKLYTVSLLLNVGCLISITLIYFLIIRFKGHNNSLVQ